MPRIPNVTPVKEELPEVVLQMPEQPTESKLVEGTPTESKPVETTPEASPEVEVIPDASPAKEEMPSGMIEENCVMIGTQKIEIKPTKLKYFRNKAASAYGIIKAVPLHELLTYNKGVLDERRSADELLYDFLVAVFDDQTLVRDHYDDLDAETIDQIVKIFGRINHVDEKEEAARKNKEAQAQKH